MPAPFDSYIATREAEIGPITKGSDEGRAASRRRFSGTPASNAESPRFLAYLLLGDTGVIMTHNHQDGTR
jgi:hypothetical protein